MTGSLQKKTLADGKEYYYMVLNFYDRHTGKRKPKWIPTELPVKGNKRKAEQLLHETLAKCSDNSYDATADTLFSEWVQMWLDSAKTYVEATTWEGYCLNAKHIIEYFGKEKLTLAKLKPQHFKKYYEYMLTYGKINKKTQERSGLAIRTVRSHKFIINAALNEAVEEEIIPRNPALTIKVAHVRKKSLAKKVVFFTLEESQQFLKFVYDLDDVLSDLIYVTLQWVETVGSSWYHRGFFGFQEASSENRANSRHNNVGACKGQDQDTGQQPCLLPDTGDGRIFQGRYR